MKYEIEIPNLPEGVRPVRLGAASEEFAYGDGAIFKVDGNLRCPGYIQIAPKAGYEFIPDKQSPNPDYFYIARRKPRKRVRIELDMPGGKGRAAYGCVSGVVIATENGEWLKSLVGDSFTQQILEAE